MAVVLSSLAPVTGLRVRGGGIAVSQGVPSTAPKEAMVMEWRVEFSAGDAGVFVPTVEAPDERTAREKARVKAALRFGAGTTIAEGECWSLPERITRGSGIAESVIIHPLADIQASTRGTQYVIREGTHIDAFVKIKPTGGPGNVTIGVPAREVGKRSDSLSHNKPQTGTTQDVA